jgi:hypothetical protein
MCDKLEVAPTTASLIKTNTENTCQTKKHTERTDVIILLCMLMNVQT